MSELPFANVYAVVVTYQPELVVFRRLLKALQAQVSCVIVVDNTWADDLRVVDVCAEAAFREVSLIRLGSNQGIARALNIGIAEAVEAGASHVLLSDQDSLPADDMVAALLHAEAELTGAGKHVGAVGPTFTDRHTEGTFPFQAEVPGKFFYGHRMADALHPIIDAISLITSGTLISVPVLQRVGPMREDLFVDNVDVEWCHRARADGYSLHGVGAAVMYHALGDNALRVWYFGWRWVSAYSPVRVYYQVRNFIALCRMSCIRARWKWRNGWYCLGFCYSQVVFGRQRLDCLKMALQGLRDGLLGRMGAWRG